MNVSSSTSLNPAMAAMLAQLTPSSAPQSAPSIPASPATSSVATVTGTGKASVSDAILDLFSKMHQASGAAHHGGGAGGSGSAGGSTTSMSTASTMIDPLSQLMAAIGDDENDVSADSDPDLSMFTSQNAASAG
ncbi:MAG: hypothetical protein WDM89_12005 [Rhizomicrobium sp.]